MGDLVAAAFGLRLVCFPASRTQRGSARSQVGVFPDAPAHLDRPFGRLGFFDHRRSRACRSARRGHAYGRRRISPDGVEDARRDGRPVCQARGLSDHDPGQGPRGSGDPGLVLGRPDPLLLSGLRAAPVAGAALARPMRGEVMQDRRTGTDRGGEHARPCAAGSGPLPGGLAVSALRRA